MLHVIKKVRDRTIDSFWPTLPFEFIENLDNLISHTDSDSANDITVKLQLTAAVIPFRADARANANSRAHYLPDQPLIRQLINGADGPTDVENRLFNRQCGMQGHP